MKTKILALAAFSLLPGICVSSADDQSPVYCSTAAYDISHLQHEKKSTDERR